MMIGSYPCCDGRLLISMPEEDIRLPAYAPDICEHCGERVWHRFSRVNPTTWTEAEFLEEYDVDKATNIITPKNPEPELTPEQIQSVKDYADALLSLLSSPIKWPPFPRRFSCKSQAVQGK